MEDLTAVYERQQRIGYPSQLFVGTDEVAAHMTSLYHDWRAPELSVCLHEAAGGYGFNQESMHGLGAAGRQAGARSELGVEVTGFEFDDSGAVTRVHTNQGDISAEQVVVAVGPWVASLWSMLGLPDRLDVRQPDGDVVDDQPMWTYWYLQEGEAAFDPKSFVTDDGVSSPVLHVDSEAPLYADDGTLITDEFWGVYFKPDRETIQGGAQPLTVGPEFTVDPYPTGSVDPGFADLWSASLIHCLARLRARAPGTARSAPAVSARSRSTTSRCSTGCARTCSLCRLQPRLQDDRRRQGDRAGARRRALVAAAPVPLRPVCDRGSAPGLAQPLPLELSRRASRASRWPNAGALSRGAERAEPSWQAGGG